MTTDLVRIFQVTSGETQRLGLQQFVIWATLVARPTETLQLQTVNPAAASLCLRAKQLNRALAVTWCRTKFGPTLKSAHFLKGKAA